MNDFDPIPLNQNWQADSDTKLLSLDMWSQYSLVQGETIALRRMFDLEPIGEVCLRFYLHIEAAPDETTVTMNGWEVGKLSAGQALLADVTDFVTLEDNVLLLTVHQKGIFGDVWLERVPCETA